MASVRDSDIFSLGIVFASSLLFLAYIFLGTPVLAVPLVLLLLGGCVARYAPKGQRVRFAFLALTSVGIAGIVVPVAVFESDWTRSLDSVALLATAVTGSILVLWASSETTNRLSST